MFEYSFPAAFGRLCVETPTVTGVMLGVIQPPSGGCVLKRIGRLQINSQPIQPPSGGCVLKLRSFVRLSYGLVPAAFGRLCVETVSDLLNTPSA